MNGKRRIVCFIITVFLQIQSACSLCNMPTAWHGLWYQRGMNSLLEITIDHIQTKGRCQDVLPVQQYYLFNDRINRCTRCLLFIDRHPNLLQYRESECNDADELSSVTLCPNMIAPDAPLYTLYRNNSKSQLCPIQAPFLLTNLIKDGIKCPQSSSSSSYISECANDHQFRLHLSPCLSFHQTFDLQLTCMATWIEGFNTYFVTRIHSKYNHYACFYFNTKQKDLSSTFSLSMATDDSCRSLNSKQLTTVMTLSSKNGRINTIDTNNSCTFPNDIQQYQWYSLNRTIQMLINNENIELINLKTNEKYQRFHCLQTIDSTNYRIRTFTNCNVKDQCLRLIRRADNVLELILNNCYDNQTSQSLIFLTKTRSISSCSISIGHFLLESIIDHHHQHHSVILRNQPKQISVGCEHRQKLMIHQIGTDLRSSLTQTDTCLASWQSIHPSIVYILAQSIYSNTSYCLTFHMTDTIIIRNNSHDCSIIHSNTNLYSAKLLNLCSQSQRVLFNRYLVLLLLFYLFSHINIHSKQ